MKKDFNDTNELTFSKKDVYGDPVNLSQPTIIIKNDDISYIDVSSKTVEISVFGDLCARKDCGLPSLLRQNSVLDWYGVLNQSGIRLERLIPLSCASLSAS